MKKLIKIIQLLKNSLLFLKDILIGKMGNKKYLGIRKTYLRKEFGIEIDSVFVISWPGVRLPPPAPETNP